MQIDQPFLLDLSETIQQWMASKDLMPNTMRAYTTETERFVGWACVEKKARSYSDLESLAITEFLEFVAAQHLFGRMGSDHYQLSAESLDQTRRIVLAFLRWLAMSGKAKAGDAWFVERQITRTLATSMTGTDPEVTTSAAQIAHDVLSTTHEAKNLTQVRNALMANLAFWCCATTSEIADLRVASLQQTARTIRIVFTGKRDRSIELPAHLNSLMKSYLRLRSRVCAEVPNEDAFLFVGSDAKSALKHWTVRRCVRSACPTSHTASLATPQSLRRAFQQITEPLPLPAGNMAYRLGNKSLLRRNAGTDLSTQMVYQVVELVGGAANAG